MTDKACRQPPWQRQLDALDKRRAEERKASRKQPEFTPEDAACRREQLRHIARERLCPQ